MMLFRKKIRKMLCLALALVMLFSVTAFAGSVYFDAGNGISATGSVGYNNATTTASSPTYVKAEVRFNYMNTQRIECIVVNDATNSGTSITAYVSIPSDFYYHIRSVGYHWAGSGYGVSN